MGREGVWGGEASRRFKKFAKSKESTILGKILGFLIIFNENFATPKILENLREFFAKNWSEFRKRKYSAVGVRGNPRS